MPVKKIREKAFMTLEEFANELGVTLQSVFRWERGFTPTKKNQRKIIAFCKKYDIKF